LSTSDESPRPKPAPGGVLLVGKQLGVAPADCIFVRDSPDDIQVGQAAGMCTVWASWHPVYREEVEKLQPHVIALGPQDVLALFSE